MRAVALVLALSGAAAAKEASEATSASASWWSVHFEQTVVGQDHGPFPAAHSGQSSPQPEPESKASVTATVFLGARLWKGARLYLDPELSAGEAFSGVTGVAAFPNGETYRIGDTRPTIVAARLYLQRSFGLGP